MTTTITTITTITTKTDLFHDLSNLAYVIADVSEGRETPHTLHQTYDICEEGNLSRVESLLELAVAEVSAATHPIASVKVRKDSIVMKERSSLSKITVMQLKEEIKEYLTAAVLYGWLSVTLPAAAGFWERRGEELLTAIAATISTAALPCRAFVRRLPPM